MNSITVVDPNPQDQPLDETVYPRRRSRSRPPLPSAPVTPPRIREEQVIGPAASAAAPQSRNIAREELDATIPPRKVATSAPVRGDLALYVLLAVLVATAWQISRMKLFRSSDDTGYWIGVVGGSMMLLLFVYPMRKYLGFMRNLGHVRHWFWLHLCLGICGPWLILVHSQFHIGSINAGVALYSMGIVVASGVIGRFIYVRIHRGLHGERTSLRELRQHAGFVEDNARSRLRFCPAVEARLLAFEESELRSHSDWSTHLRQATILPLQQWITYFRCVHELRKPLNAMAVQYGWNASDLRRRKRRARRLVDQYLHAVVRVAQFNAYERVFALWHLAHLPFIYLLIISAVVHVVAVHMY
jgi:hypothetical protein